MGRRLSEEGRLAARRESYRRYREKNKDKTRLANKLWAEKNREHRREYSRTRRLVAASSDNAKRRSTRAADPEKYRRKDREKYAADPSRKRRNVYAWRKSNPEKVNATNRNRYARQVGVAGSASAEQVAARVAFFGGVCAYCGGPYQAIDHVIPISRGGTNWPANMRPACVQCNSSKHARALHEWKGRAA